jgi:membrane fusion protein, multidrug efflux system
MKNTLFAPALVGLVLVGLSACSKPEAPTVPVRAVRTLVLAGGSSVDQREFAAEIRARTEVRLGFQVGGRISSRAVNLGDAVTAGQALAQLDPQDLNLGQEAARAWVASAQAAFDQSAADLKRYQELRAQNFIGAAEMDRREAAFKAARAQLDQAKAQAGVQVNQAAYARLAAPAAGVVTAVEAEAGQVVAAGTPVLRLALDGPRDAVFAVPETEVAAVRTLLGKSGAARMTLWGESSAVPATVREVAASADPVTRTFLVKADVPQASARLGRTATVSLPGPTLDGAISLPLAAVVAQSGGQSAVWVLDPAAMTTQLRTVVLGRAAGNQVLIPSGLKLGDEVITAGTHTLSPGLVVKRYQEPGRPAAALPAAAAASR